MKLRIDPDKLAARFPKDHPLRVSWEKSKTKAKKSSLEDSELEADEIDRHITDMINQGATCAVVVKKLGLSYAVVYKRVKQLGLRFRIGNRQAKFDIEKLKELIIKGCNATEIAKELKISRKSIYNWASKLGLTVVKIKNACTVSSSEIVKLAEQGYNGRQIAETLGVSIDVVYSRLAYLGVRLKTSKKRE